MSTAPAIVWLRDDLRLEDNPALVAAVETGRPVLPLYILDDAAAGRWKMGHAARWWLKRSLEALGLPVLRRKGDTARIIDEVIAATSAEAIFWNRRYEPWATALDRSVKAGLRDRGLEARSFAARTLHEPFEIQRDGGAPYKVFTPYFRAWLAKGEPRRPAPRPREITLFEHELSSDDLTPSPARGDWERSLAAAWTPGEAAAQARLDAFLDGPVETYGEHRDFPAIDGVSRLSPHLRFGEIGPRQILRALSAVPPEVAHPFSRQLAWRDFAWHSLHYFPDLPEISLRHEFEALEWLEGEAALERWRLGRTGFPIVDAGMRQLERTGWMHNRVRMIVGSFLTKDLLVHWREGAAWFWDRLVDADLANNSMGWQWVAGSGIDAAPFFRIFNPTTQARKFDPAGRYAREWLPELRDLPDEWIHEPSKAPADVLTDAGLRLGETYPLPIVDHGSARRRALEAYGSIKKPGSASSA